MDAEMCEFTETRWKVFVKAYNKAIVNKRPSFFFEDHEVLVEYAKYIIEYLEPKFKKHGRQKSR